MLWKPTATLLLALTIAADAWSADSIELRLAAFDEAATPAEMVSQTNGFFLFLYEADFIDEPYCFPAETDPDTLRQQVWYWAGEYYYEKQQYELAETFGLKALPLYRVSNDRTGEADCLNLLAIANTRLSHYQRAIDFSQQCYRLDEASGDADRIATSLNSLAAIYLSANQPAEAERYVQKGLELTASTGNLPRRSVLLGTASEVYHTLGDDQRALDYASQGYDIELQLGREYRAMVRLTQKASALIGLQQYDEACHLLANSAIPYFRHAGDRQSLGISCNKLAQALHYLQREQEARHYYREGADIFRSIGDKNNEMHSRKGLYESLWQEYPDSARMELERFNALKDSLYTNASAESLARYNAEFGVNWLQQENDAERSAKQRAITVGIAACLLIIALSIIIWWKMRRRQRRQHLINTQLSQNIDELRQQYRELSVRYDHALMTRPDDEGQKDLSSADRDFIEKTIDIINELIISGQVDAESVAERHGMSLFQYRQRLSALTGETPQAFIAIIRMRRARYLLDNRPELNISEIAQLCAYNDTPNFSRAFKKTFGITPTQYIEKQRQ